MGRIMQAILERLFGGRAPAPPPGAEELRQLDAQATAELVAAAERLQRALPASLVLADMEEMNRIVDLPPRWQDTPRRARR